MAASMHKHASRSKRLTHTIQCVTALCVTTPVMAQTAPAQTTQLQPSLSVMLYATHTSAPPVGIPAGDDLLLAVTPGISFFKKGANSQIDGQGQLALLHYTKGSQSDRIVPTGQLNLHSDFARSGLGIDGSVSASQVKPTVNAAPSATPTTTDTYTNTTVRVSPFIDKQIDEQTRATARLDRSVLHTTQLSTNLAPRADSYSLTDSIGLNRRATPLGYGLAWQHQQTKVSGQADPSLDEQAVRARALYAPVPELELGLILGAASTRIGGSKVNDQPKGWQVQWRPTERTVFKGEVEQRFFGKAWSADVSHRLPWFAMGVSSDRSESTYASSIGTIAQGSSLRGLYDAMLTTRFPNATERRNAVNTLLARRDLSSQVSASGDVYDTSAMLRQNTAVRLAFMGRRDIVTLATGVVKTAPLTLRDASLSLITPAATTKSSYFDLQLNHQLTLQTTWSGNVRWSRGTSVQSTPAAVVDSRDFTMRSSVTTSLTRNTKATMGLQRQIAHNPSTTTTDEASVFAGLDHRF